VIIHADAMNMNAANSLLKSLEEPADNSYILLFTTQPSQLMPTIRSRCQQLRLAQPSQAQALTWLQAQTLAPAQTAYELLTITGGRPLAALAEDASERLKQQTLFFNHLKAVLTGQLSLIEIAVQWEKYDRQELLNWQLIWVQQWIRQSLGGGDSSLQELTELNPYLKPATAWLLYERLLELKALSTHPLNGRLFVENMLALWL
jgi:DNA polymerase-3 subunit delta'